MIVISHAKWQSGIKYGPLPSSAVLRRKKHILYLVYLYPFLGLGLFMRDMVKHESWNSKVGVQIHEFKFTCYQFNFTSYEFKSKSYEFKSTSQNLNRWVTCSNLRVTSSNLRVTCSNLRVTSSNLRVQESFN